MRERDWQQTILDAAGYLGYRCYHTRFSVGSEAGFPDIVCAKEGQPLVAIECKTERGKLTVHQEGWLQLLASVPGVVAMVARPSDWEYVERVLKGEAT